MSQPSSDTSQQPNAAPQFEEEETFVAIRWLVAFLRVLEDLITAVSGYSVVFALAVGSIDLFSDGKLTADLPWLEILYAFALAIGIAGQLIAVTVRSAQAFRAGNALAGIGFTVLALLLGGVEYEAATVYGFHVVFHEPVAQSLNQLGITQANFIQIRSATAVAIALLSGFLRYQPKVKKSAEEVEKEEEEKRRKALAKAATRQAQIAGYVNAGKAAIGKPIEEPIVAQSPTESHDDSGVIPLGNSQEIDTESTPLWLPKDKWRWQELQRWCAAMYGLKISEAQAKSIIKAAGGKPFPRAGNPLVTTIKRAQTRAIRDLNLDRITPLFGGERAAND
jgi:hypothetical protein